MTVLSELRNRGVKGVCIVACGGLQHQVNPKDLNRATDTSSGGGLGLFRAEIVHGSLFSVRDE